MSDSLMSDSMESKSLLGKRVVLGVTGGIAAYKSIEVMRRLVDLGAHVVPVLTDAALNMVGPTTFTALGSEPVKTSLWTDADPIPHTTMGQTADLIVVCPATARVLADYRIGRSADLLSATLIATEAPVVLCPAMHTEMWDHPAVQENLTVLADRGVIVVPPEEGRLAGGDIGKGRLAAPERIVETVVATLVGDRPLAGCSVVVTAGGTREAIDPVRYIGNRSTGKQGHALAVEAHRRGATVTLIRTVELPVPAGIEVVQVTTAAQMEAAVNEVAATADIIIMAAAVADFRPAQQADQKIKKADGVPQIVLEPTNDILAGLGSQKRAGQVLVGFAAETNDLAANARSKLERKGADFIVANDVSAPGVGFAHDTNEVTIHGADGSVVHVPLRGKNQVAGAVLDIVSARPSATKS
jgi:phosphopantothenoylcysteine decarboxylase/phosphopantothenate--cysteine ligase